MGILRVISTSHAPFQLGIESSNTMFGLYLVRSGNRKPTPNPPTVITIGVRCNRPFVTDINRTTIESDQLQHVSSSIVPYKKEGAVAVEMSTIES